MDNFKYGYPTLINEYKDNHNNKLDNGNYKIIKTINIHSYGFGHLIIPRGDTIKVNRYTGYGVHKDGQIPICILDFLSDQLEKIN